jgi:hypothetical protein
LLTEPSSRPCRYKRRPTSSPRSRADKAATLLQTNNTSNQGCQMVYFRTKNPNLGIFENIFNGRSMYFMAILYILYPIWILGIFYDDKSGNPASNLRFRHFCSNNSYVHLCTYMLLWWVHWRTYLEIMHLQPGAKLIQLYNYNASRLERFYKCRRKYFCFQNALGCTWRCQLLQRWRCNSRS